MKIGFFGTPHIAAVCLRALHGKGHDILFCVTPEDKPSGRGRIPVPCEAKETALSLNIPVIHPLSLKDDSFIHELKTAGADIYVVVAYGAIIPSEVYTVPRLKTVNLHPSLLPRLRGAAPVPWAIINGEKISGVTVQLINERMDAGDIILQEELPIGPDETAGELFEKAIPLGAHLLLSAIGQMERGEARPRVQDESFATKCGKITSETARIRWDQPASILHNLIRGMNPKPGAWTVFREKTVKIWKSSVDPAIETKDPGTLVTPGGNRLLVHTGEGCIVIHELQLEGKKRMSAGDFLNGIRLAPGERFS